MSAESRSGLDAMERAMDVGDFRDALARLQDLGGVRGFQQVLDTDALDPERAGAATLIAELLFYQGKNGAAHDLLRPYALTPTEFLAMPIAPRAKLQLAEYFYSRSDFNEAIRIATAIHDECEKAADDFG